jgi:putative chitinase
MVTAEQLQKLHISPALVGPLNEAFQQWDISTPLEQAAFIAQCGHECRNFTVLEEDLRYKAATLLKLFPLTPKRAWGFTPESAAAYAGQPEKIANRIYGWRMGNRAESFGDGWRFRGSGYLQLTGHDNFYHAGKALGVDFVMKPDLVRTPEYAMQTAAWYWNTHNCNSLANAKNWTQLTKVVNGGLIGFEDRVAHTESAIPVLSA